MKVKANRNLLLIAFVAILSCALIARDVLSISVNKFILLGICSVFLFVADETTKISMIAFMLPLVCGLPSTYIFLVIIALMLLRNRINATTVVYFVVFIVLEFIALAFSNHTLDNEVVKQLLFTCVFFLLLFTDEYVDYLQCMKLYFWGAILVSFVISAYSIMRAPENWLSLFAKGLYRFGDQALDDIQGMTLRLNSNSLAYFSLTGMLQGFIVVKRSNGLNKWFSLAGVLFLAIAGLLSVSRSWLLVAAGCICILIFALMKSAKGLFIMLGVLGVTFIVGVVVQQIFPELFIGMVTRMTSESFEGGNGRVEISAMYFDLFFNSIRTMLIGAGATYYRTALGMVKSAHNGTLQVLMCYGLIGSTVFVGGMLAPLKRKRNEQRGELINWIPLIGTVVFVQTIQFINPCYLMLPYVIAVYAVKEGRRTHN